MILTEPKNIILNSFANTKIYYVLNRYENLLGTKGYQSIKSSWWSFAVIKVMLLLHFERKSDYKTLVKEYNLFLKFIFIFLKGDTDSHTRMYTLGTTASKDWCNHWWHRINNKQLHLTISSLHLKHFSYV